MQCKTETSRSRFFDLYFYASSEIQQYQKPTLTFANPVVTVRTTYFGIKNLSLATQCIYPYPTAFPYGNGMVLHFCQQQESNTTKIVHKVINKGLKTYV